MPTLTINTRTILTRPFTRCTQTFNSQHNSSSSNNSRLIYTARLVRVCSWMLSKACRTAIELATQIANQKLKGRRRREALPNPARAKAIKVSLRINRVSNMSGSRHQATTRSLTTIPAQGLTRRIPQRLITMPQTTYIRIITIIIRTTRTHTRLLPIIIIRT